MLHGFSKSMFHRKFHRALLGAKNCLGFSDIPKKSPAPQLALQLSQRWPGWILYAAGFFVFHAVANGLAALMDPKTLAQTKTPSDSN